MSRLDSSYARLLNIQRSVTPEGRETLMLPFSPVLLGRPGFLHGGAIAGFLALVCDQAVAGELATGKDGFICVTSTFQFLRGGRELDMYGKAEIAHRSATTMTLTAYSWQ